MMLGGLILIVIGVLSAASWIVARRPNANELIERLVPFQGWIGVGAALWGAWSLVDVVAHIDMLGQSPIQWITWLVVSAVTLGNGFLLGFGIGMSFVKDEAAKAKVREAYGKVAPYQTRLGIAAIAIGTWSVIRAIV